MKGLAEKALKAWNEDEDEAYSDEGMGEMGMEEEDMPMEDDAAVDEDLKVELEAFASASAAKDIAGMAKALKAAIALL